MQFGYDNVSGLSSSRRGGANVVNVTLQDVCPANTANHTAIGFDPVGYAMALDALEHEGPANLERIQGGNVPGSSPVCGKTVMPGVDPSTLDSNLAALDAATAAALFNGAHLSEEPALACYTRGNGPKR